MLDKEFKAKVDKSFEALKKFDWGTDRAQLNPIDEAVVKTHGDEAARKELETQVAAVLKTQVSRDAKDYVCRTLMLIGSAASVPALAELLTEKDNSHMARYALERIQAPEAAQALRDALSKTNGAQKVGVIGSLGVRKDTQCVHDLVALLGDTDPAVVRAAALALGDIGTSDAAKALTDAKSTNPDAKIAIVDGSLGCAESLLADGKKDDAMAVYKALGADGQPKHVRLAAKKGMLAAAGKKN
jgi:HEAT repeat protein